MSNLEYVLKDFYDCVNIHIRYLDNNFNLIYKTNAPSYVDKLINDVNLYNDIRKNTISLIKLTYYKNIHFIVLPLINSSHEGYLIVGPFRSKNICMEIDMPFKPFYCIDYIVNILKSIIKEKLNKKTNFSSYVESAIRYIHQNYNEDIKIDDICSNLNINKSYFCRIFKKESGYTFSNFLNKFRIEKSKEFLIKKDYSILDVAMCVGYNNHNYYSSLFKKYNDETPIEFRNSHNKKR